ncbi:RrF2 family transcriptional regulator [Acanthopleuribacter pedis]|uniref:Rrf2 family transcriptional regulator n=1 Tax=Acanthopleuribacter pedis TaxID=442870 RepID=A0A8J7PZX3_9BACT|nr:Rrf2 family transcriptional regulator [Acanthopleuribacter pedis]MBO1317827.1 Rrf2 family transcriptional regulator [Acanthopleuribacter pedis]
MLRLPKSVDYGVLILLTLFEADSDTPLSAQQIAETCGLPHQQVAKLLKVLQRQDVVSSTRGPRGGYALKVDAGSMNLLAVHRLIEGPLTVTECMNPEDCQCRAMASCRLRPYMEAVDRALQQALEGITLAAISESRPVFAGWSLAV